jgi:hypothetical protein
MTPHAPTPRRTNTKWDTPRFADLARRGNSKSNGNSRNKESPLNTVIPTGASHSRREWEAEWRDLEFATTSRGASCGRIS